MSDSAKVSNSKPLDAAPPKTDLRDDLARIIFTATKNAHWQEWEKSSDGIRAWCRAKADEAMAAGWRKVGAITDEEADQILAGCKQAGIFISPYKAEPSDVPSPDQWTTFRREAIKAIVAAALADPAGANGGA